MSQELADVVRERCPAVAVSDAYKLAPWADALVSADAAWWRQRPDALLVPSRKFSAVDVPGVTLVPHCPEFVQGTNSGLLGMRVARILGASRILLLGFDARGTHFFGPHKLPLKDTSAQRRKMFADQFSRWPQAQCPVINCTQGSALTCFPMGDISEELPSDPAI